LSSPSRVISLMLGSCRLGYDAVVEFVAAPDKRWSDALSVPAREEQALWHAHLVTDGVPSDLSMCSLFRLAGKIAPWEPAPGVRCRRCEAEIDNLS